MENWSAYNRAAFGELLKRTLGVYARSFGTLMAFSYLYVFPVLAVLAGYIALGAAGISTSLHQFGPMNLRPMPPIFLSLLLLTFFPLMLMIIAWAILLMPRYNGALVIITGNSLSGKTTTMRDAHAALRGGRYKQLILVALCVTLMASGVSFGGPYLSIFTNGIRTNLLSGASSLARMPFAGSAGNAFMGIVLLLTSAYSLIAIASSIVSLLQSLLLSLSMPVAVYENKRHFFAVVQSMRHAAKRFGTLLGGYALFALCALVVSIVCGVFIAAMIFVGVNPWPILFIIMALIVMLMPLPMIFYTVVYRDIRDQEGYTAFIRQDAEHR